MLHNLLFFVMSGERDFQEIMEIEEDNSRQSWKRVMSPEIVEIEEESQNIISRDVIIESISDVFVAVGKNDLDTVKWTIDHAVSPGTRVYLIHVFSPVTQIPTPVGKLSKSQLSKEQIQVYVNEENNRRQSLLQKYIRLCMDAKIAVDTMLIESNTVAKAILDLIPVINITNLVMGTKRPPSLRLLRKGTDKGEFVRKNAPDFCEVTIVYNGKKVSDGHQPRQVVGMATSTIPTTNQHGSKTTPQQSERKFLECICFSGKFD